MGFDSNRVHSEPDNLSNEELGRGTSHHMARF